MEHSRKVHDENTRGVVKDEPKAPTKRKRQPFIHLCFGHDLQAVEGFTDCDKKLWQAFALEMAEGNASTEFAGAVKTVPNDKAQEDDDVVELNEEENLELDSHKTDDADEDLFDQSQFAKMDPAVRQRAKEVYKRLRSTIKVIPLSLQARGEKIVETAASNDDSPEFFFAAHDSRRIDHDEKGIPYLQKGAVGPPLMAIKMALPHAYPSRHGFKWAVIDGCWRIPTSNIIPLERTMFVDPPPWMRLRGSPIRCLYVRCGGKGTTLKEGGWADAYSVLAAVYVSHDPKRRHPTAIVRQIDSTSWLFALRKA